MKQLAFVLDGVATPIGDVIIEEIIENPLIPIAVCALIACAVIGIIVFCKKNKNDKENKK